MMDFDMPASINAWIDRWYNANGAVGGVHDAALQPYSHHFLHSLLRQVLAHLYGQRVAELYSWHSYRSGLATALHAAGVVPPAACRVLRYRNSCSTA